MSEQASTTGFDGRTLFRWALTLDTPKVIYTWAASEEEAIRKTVRRRDANVTDIRPAGDPLEDRP